ncbi:hypothetical protein C7967_11534 [Thalassospira sp. 11-3]|nr:hypothetical protein C7967_11534 [Thalassospira sp. 11-3]
MGVEQTGATRNQSNLKISHKHIFLFDNKYAESIFNNNTGDTYTLKPGLVVIRNTAATTKVIPAVSGATLINIVGVVSTNDDIEMSDGSDANITICDGGVINKDLLILPSGVTLDTLIATHGITVGDKLRSLGFDLEGAVENTKFDNE